jgi:hypothetical protein
VPEPDKEIGDLRGVDFDGMGEQDAARLMAARARKLAGDDNDLTTGISLNGKLDLRKPGERDRLDTLRVQGFDVSDATVVDDDDEDGIRAEYFLERQQGGW